MENSMDEAQIKRLSRLAQSDAGRALISKLSESKSEQINAAVAAGDAERLKQLVTEFLSTPEAMDLKRKIGESDG